MIKRIAILGLLALNGWLLASIVAPADAAITFPVKWSPNVAETYHIDDNVDSRWRDDIRAGMENFSDKAGGQAPRFDYGGIETSSYDMNHPCVDGSTVFSVQNLGVVGLTTWCVNVSGGQERIVGFDIALNRSEDWYADSGNPPATKYDIRSITTHEAGHAASMYGHFDDGTSTCPIPRTSATATMCPGNAAIRGTIWLRTLENADRNRIDDAY